MKKFLISFVVGLTPLVAFAFVPIQEENGFSIGAEWIYFSPTSESVTYANLVSVSVGGRSDHLQNNRMDQFYSGYRVLGSYTFCDHGCFLAARWTHLDASHHSSITAPAGSTINALFNIPLVLPLFTQAEAQTHFSYSSVDGIMGCSLLPCSCFKLIGTIGIHYVNLHSNNHFLFNEPVALLQKLEEDFWGVGPEMGLDFGADIGCHFSLFGSVTGAFLAGKPKEKFVNYTGAPLAPLTLMLQPQEESWKLVPYGDFSLGISYFYDLCDCWSCFTNTSVQLTVGYEAMVYWQGLYRLSPSSSANIFATNELHFVDRNITMHGPFVSAVFSF